MPGISKFRCRRVLFHLKKDVLDKCAADDMDFSFSGSYDPGYGMTAHADASVGVVVGVGDIYKGNPFGNVSDIEFAEIVVASFHEGEHIRQILSGDELMAMAECLQQRDHGLYMDRYYHNPREIRAEWHGIREADAFMCREFGKAGEGAVLRMLNDKIKNNSYYIWPGNGKTFQSLEEVDTLFAEADEKAMDSRFWYESRCREPDLVFQIMDIHNPPLDREWDDVFNELAAGPDFETSVRKLFALGCIVYPEDAEELGISMDEGDIRGMFESHIPQTFISIRERIRVGNSRDLPRKRILPKQGADIPCREGIPGSAEDVADKSFILRPEKRHVPAWNYDVKQASSHYRDAGLDYGFRDGPEL